MAAGVEPEMTVFPISIASLVLVAFMERVLPYRREWNRSHGDLRTDSLYFVRPVRRRTVAGSLAVAGTGCTGIRHPRIF
jgi:hypothetical protein